MKHFKSLTIWTLLAHFFIVFIGGHGGGTIGLFEIITIVTIPSMDNSFSTESTIASPFFWCILFTVLGQCLIITALFTKTALSFYLKLIGILFLLLGYLFPLGFVWNEGAFIISIGTGIPFLFLSGILFYKHIVTNYKLIKKNVENRPNSSLIGTNIKRPDIDSHQFAVSMADGATGKVLTTDGNVCVSGKGEVYAIFGDIESARLYIKERQATNDTIEFVIHNSKHEFVEYHEALKWRGK